MEIIREKEGPHPQNSLFKVKLVSLLIIFIISFIFLTCSLALCVFIETQVLRVPRITHMQRLLKDLFVKVVVLRRERNAIKMKEMGGWKSRG